MDLSKMDLDSFNEQELTDLLEAAQGLEEDEKTNPFYYFKPLPTQQKFLLSPAKIKALMGGNQSGKTTTGAFHVIKDCIENAGHIWWCGAETFEKSVKVQQAKILSMLPMDEVQSAHYSNAKGFRNNCVIFKNGSVIAFKTYAQGREGWQGGTINGIWMDEEPPFDVYMEALPRVLKHEGILIFTMTALSGFTKVVEELIHGKLKGIDMYYISTYENIKENGGGLSKQAVIALENQYDDPDDRKARLQGIPSPKSGIIFKQFKDDFPCVIPYDKCEDPNPLWPTLVSIDPHGNTPHAVLWIQVGPNGHLWIVKERPWLKTEGKLDRVNWITLGELASQINYENRDLNIDTILIDKHGSNAKNAVTGTTIQDELFRAGLFVQDAGGDVTNKILLTQRYFREGKIHIYAECWNLLWEIRRYVWMDFISEKTADRKEEKQVPRKKNDHLIDCMMNAILHISTNGLTTGMRTREAMVSKQIPPRRRDEDEVWERPSREFSEQRTLLSIYE